MKLKVSFNIKAVSAKKIVLPYNVIEAGEVFKLKDAYKEGDMLVLGIKIGSGVHEALFKINNASKVKTKAQLKQVVESIVFPYIEGANYTIINNK